MSSAQNQENIEYGNKIIAVFGIFVAAAGCILGFFGFLWLKNAGWMIANPYLQVVIALAMSIGGFILGFQLRALAFLGLFALIALACVAGVIVTIIDKAHIKF